MSEQKFLINGGFFDSINKDKQYNADDMNRPYRRIITEGIYATPKGTPSTDFQVLSANNEMNIIVKSGEGMLAGRWVESASDIAITVANNTEIVPRKDSIILQVDKRQSARVPNIVYRTGRASSNPQPPAINEQENVYELRIANIYVVAGAVSIGQDVITDLRGSNECPWITSLIKQVDIGELFNQYKVAYENYYSQIQEEFSATEEELQASFLGWFNNIKEKLSEDPAGALQLEIEDANKEIEKINDNLNKMKTDILLAAHPVGSYYWSELPTEPSELFGGTWEKIEDVFILAEGPKHPVLETSFVDGETFYIHQKGGNDKIKLNIEQLPKHRFSVAVGSTSGESNGYGLVKSDTSGFVDRVQVSNGKTYTNYVGSGSEIDITPPYAAAFCWKRTA